MLGLFGGFVLIIIGLLLVGPDDKGSGLLTMVGGGIIGIGALFAGISLADLKGII